MEEHWGSLLEAHVHALSLRHPHECFLSSFGAQYRSGYEEAAGGGNAGLQAGEEICTGRGAQWLVKAT